MLVPKAICVQKDFGSKKVLDPKNFLSKKFWVRKIVGHEIFWSKKFWVKKIWSKKFLAKILQKNFGTQSSFGTNILLDPKYFWPTHFDQT